MGWAGWCGDGLELMQQTQQRANDVKIGKTSQSTQTVKGWLLSARKRSKVVDWLFVLFKWAGGCCVLPVLSLVSMSVPSLTANKVLIRAY